MRRIAVGLFVLMATGALLFLVPQIRSQSPERRAGQAPGGTRGGAPRPPRGGGLGGGFGPPPPPVLSAIDTNKDGEISAEELKKAATALKTLDKNKDGQIADAELRPDFGAGGFPPPGGGRGGPGGFDFFGGGGATERVAPEKIKFEDGVASIPDHATFQKLSYKGEEVMIDTFLSGLEFVKFTLDKAATDEQQL
ncbi:MAG: hypothetical protein QGF59_25980, partial [Pirellulaceae bacterium]|nr:hypothetical protein [Pirellulaceae bacterium]